MNLTKMKKIMFFAAVLAAFVSCQKNDVETTVTPKDESLKINLSMNLATKITDTAFESGDAVGVYVVNYVDEAAGTLAASGNHYDNVKLTYGTAWTPAEEMFWLDKSTKADFYCYYPYADPGSVTAYPFAVKADQSSLADYKASDFIWGKASGVAPTSELIQIAANHIMSNVAIYLQPGDGFTTETFAAAEVSVAVRNVLTNAAVNLSDGTVAATGSAAEVIPYDEGTYYRAVIVPQVVADGTSLIVVTVDDTEYALKKGFTFVSGKQHKFTVTVNKTGSGINIGIGDWESGGEDNGGSAE